MLAMHVGFEHWRSLNGNMDRIIACGNGAEWQLALELLSTLANSDVGSGDGQLTVALLSTMANSDVGGGEWQLASALLSTMATSTVFGGTHQIMEKEVEDEDAKRWLRDLAERTCRRRSSTRQLGDQAAYSVRCGR